MSEASSLLRKAAPAPSIDAWGQSLEQFRRYLLEVARHAIGPALKVKGRGVRSGAGDVSRSPAAVPPISRAGLTPNCGRGCAACCCTRRPSSAAGMRSRPSGRLSREVSDRLETAMSCDPARLPVRRPRRASRPCRPNKPNVLRAAIDRLPDDYRQVMTLRYLGRVGVRRCGAADGPVGRRRPDALGTGGGAAQT